MQLFWTLLLGGIALTWVIGGIRLIRGMSRLPRISGFEPLPQPDCPRVSILFTARDEAAKLPQALPTLLAQDYPDFEVVAVDDRSGDGTAQVLDEYARRFSTLKVVHLTALPPGWLGKPHGLFTAYQHATGDWLVFTDADVRFHPALVRRALSLARQMGWDHLPLLGLPDSKGFWEKTALTYFGLALVLHTEPWNASNPRSGRYMGVGAFQLIRRSTYEAIGTHRRLAMEIVDDIKLGKLVKEGGFRSGAAVGEDNVRVRWQEGLGNIVRGLTKNGFAALDYRIDRTLGSLLAVILLSILPYAVLPFVSGTARLLAVVSLAATLAVHGRLAREFRVSPLYALTHPLGGLVMGYIIFRSAVVTLWRGGVLWRDTFYSLDELRKGLV